MPEIIDPSNRKNLVPTQYYDLLPLFRKKEADKLPPHQYVDHAIPLITDKKPPMCLMYSMSDSELAEVWKWIEENMSKGFTGIALPLVPLLFFLSKRKMEA